MDGILCIDKPEGMTSFLCVAIVRRLLGEKKVGHAGTLDPNATGVLPILVGRGTKLLDHLPCHDKCYTATLRFGAVSDTLDIWGEVEETGKPIPTLAEVEAALPAFRGDILQVPPMTSALKKDGVRLYELARQGIEIEREAREITVYRLEIVSYNEQSGELTVDCACSKGTYVRTIGADLGRALGCGAVMTALCRTEAAGYALSACHTLEQLRAMSEEQRQGLLLPTETLFTVYPSITVSPAQATRFQNGGALALDRLKTAVDGTVRVCAPDGTFLGLGTPQDGELTVRKLFPI